MHIPFPVKSIQVNCRHVLFETFTLTKFSCLTRDIILTSLAKRLSRAALTSIVLPRLRTLMATIRSPYLKDIILNHGTKDNNCKEKLFLQKESVLKKNVCTFHSMTLEQKGNFYLHKD